MIIECEKCKSTFNLDESLVKAEGSKVRCSICKEVFLVSPPEKAQLEEPAPDEFLDEELEEDLALDSLPDIEEIASEPMEEGAEEVDFDKAMEGRVEEEEDIQAVSLEGLPDFEEEKVDVEEDMDRDAEIEEEVPLDDAEKKISAEPEEDVDAGPPKKKPGRLKLFPIILVIIVLLLAGGVAVFFLAPDLLPDSLSFLKPTKEQPIPDQGVSRLSFQEVTGFFIRSDTAGQLFVIKGMVTNNYSMSRRFINIKGSLLNDKGQVIKTKLIYAGNTFSEEQLKELPLKDLGKGLRNRFGQGKMNFNIKPGGTIPFMIIFENLPENLSEFTVEAVSSFQVK